MVRQHSITLFTTHLLDFLNTIILDLTKLKGLLTREEALELCVQDNKIKYDTLKNFSDVIGFNLDNVLSKINCLDKLY